MTLNRRHLGEVAREWTEELGDVPVGPFLIAATIQRLSQYIEREFARVARKYGIGPGDLRILFVLARMNPAHQLAPKDLIKELLVTSGAVSKQVDRLAEQGLVTRIADPDILRGVLIRLEPEGRKIADDAAREIMTENCGLETLAEAQSTRILRTLNGLLTVVESHATAE
ncbi:MarR family transcriptional regulator [Dactylosporangium sp. NPDC051485]|uniref:MarR family winged helix-turn-helix transcriptional regulator n=1 Tax=Dactylosporangium sp. NPDC051485 TaxID=3154846 RepID=UPI0034411162